jgi:hypothetical protein
VSSPGFVLLGFMLPSRVYSFLCNGLYSNVLLVAFISYCIVCPSIDGFWLSKCVFSFHGDSIRFSSFCPIIFVQVCLPMLVSNMSSISYDVRFSYQWHDGCTLLEHQLLSLTEHMSSALEFSQTHVGQPFTFCVVLCVFVFLLTTITCMSDLLPFEISDYSFGILKLYCNGLEYMYILMSGCCLVVEWSRVHTEKKHLVSRNMKFNLDTCILISSH